MAISQIMIAASSGGSTPPKSATWTGIDYEPINEGQLQQISIVFENWDNSTVYWSLVNSSGVRIDAQVVGGEAYGELYPGNGNSTQYFSFTFKTDTTTEGTQYYRVRVGSVFDGSDYADNGYYTIRDTSKAPATVFSLEPANWSGGIWPDTSGNSRDANTYYITASGNAGGSILFDGTSGYASVTSLASSVYDSVTISAFVRPSALSGTQVVAAKTFCYLVKINSNGSITLLVGDGSSWLMNINTVPGVLTADQWANITVTVDKLYSRIYVNGVRITNDSGSGMLIGNNDKPVNIGAYTAQSNDTNHGDYFGGYIGVIYMANYALTYTNIVDLYNTYNSRYGLSSATAPVSLGFNGTDNHYVQITGNKGDWNLGDNYTIEWWHKIPIGASGFLSVLSQDANQAPYAGIDIFINAGNIQMFNGNYSFPEAAATRGQWNHIAVQKDGSTKRAYINGVEQNIYSSASGSLTNDSLDLVIGSRTYDGGGNFYGQYFNGKLADIRISNFARYSGTFSPPTSFTVDANTKLAVSGELVDLTSRHTITNNSASVETDFPYL